MPTISVKSTPVLTATKLSVTKLIERAGFTKTLAMNSFLSITAAVLLVESQTSLKSVIPLLHLISLRKGSTTLTNSALVNSSLNSNITFLAATDIALSIDRNNLLTLILSNAEFLNK